MVIDIQRPVRIVRGYGSSYGHFGELIQGEFPDRAGHTTRGLVSTPYPWGASTSYFEPTAASHVTPYPSIKRKAARATALYLAEAGLPAGGRLAIFSTLHEGLGCGSSTADSVASVRAAATAHGRHVDDVTVARIVVEAEEAADGLMFEDRAVLFAHREGRTLEDFGLSLPPMVIVGALIGDPVDTLAMAPAPYCELDIRRFDELLARLRRAVAEQDVVGVAEVATASARINQRHLAMPGYEALESTADACGAPGVVISHSGAVGGVVLDPADNRLQWRIAAVEADLVGAGLRLLTTFITRPANRRTHEVAA